jgi:phosphoribosyl 1,2-cyclic phosphodiesterase
VVFLNARRDRGECHHSLRERQIAARSTVNEPFVCTFRQICDLVPSSEARVREKAPFFPRDGLMSVVVKFWGTRGSIPTPGGLTKRYGGNTSCVEIRAGNALIICDGGTGLRELGIDLMQRHKSQPIVGHMFFSHAHWDHIQGFPFFNPVYVQRNTFYVYGATGGDRSMYNLLSGQMSSEYFPVRFAELGARVLPGELRDAIEVDGVRIETFPQWHPGGSVAFAFYSEGKKIVFATDNELDQVLVNAAEVEKDPAIPRQLPSDLILFAKDADLLISDGQYLDSEYVLKRGWGHPRVGTTVDFAVQAGAKQLAITHHDPMQTDDDVDAKIAIARQRAALYPNPPAILGAFDSLEIVLGE